MSSMALQGQRRLNIYFAQTNVTAATTTALVLLIVVYHRYVSLMYCVLILLLVMVKIQKPASVAKKVIQRREKVKIY